MQQSDIIGALWTGGWSGRTTRNTPSPGSSQLVVTLSVSLPNGSDTEKNSELFLK